MSKREHAVDAGVGREADPGSYGQLFVCGTPIGNLEDVTLRLLRTLREVSLIAAEDTRHTRKLLTHYDIHTPLISLHEHNEHGRITEMLDRLRAGQSVALVSDAGMPAISDPGGELIRAAADEGIDIVVVPGPTAFVVGLVGSGLSAERFAFEGFLPRQTRRRRERLRELAVDSRTLIFYEAPHRLRRTLRDMLDTWGDRRACVARELTKAFEQWQRAPLSELLSYWTEHNPRGEFVIVVEGAAQAGGAKANVAETDVATHFGTADVATHLGTADVARADDVASGDAERCGDMARLASSVETGNDGAVSGSETVERSAQPSEEFLRHLVAQRMQDGMDKKTAIRAVSFETGVPRRVVYRAATTISAVGPASDTANAIDGADAVPPGKD